MNLPGRFVEVVQCPFDAEERAFYDALEQKTSLTFNKARNLNRLSSCLLTSSSVHPGRNSNGKLHVGLDNAAPPSSR